MIHHFDHQQNVACVLPEYVNNVINITKISQSYKKFILSLSPSLSLSLSLD